MEQIQNLGIMIVVFFQGLGAWLVASMHWVSYLGIEGFFCSQPW